MRRRRSADTKKCMAWRLFGVASIIFLRVRPRHVAAFDRPVRLVQRHIPTSTYLMIKKSIISSIFVVIAVIRSHQYDS